MFNILKKKHDLHCDLLLLTEKVKIESGEKLVSIFHVKK